MSLQAQKEELTQRAKSAALGWYKQGYVPDEIVLKMSNTSRRTIYRFLDLKNMDPQDKIEHHRNRILREDAEVKNSEGIKHESDTPVSTS